MRTQHDLYAGLVFDTGAFRHQTTTPEHSIWPSLDRQQYDHSLISAKFFLSAQKVN